jgi:hypothetical protein
LHRARAQVVAAQEMWGVFAPGALHCPVSRARSAAVPPKNPLAPEWLRAQSAAEQLHLAPTRVVEQALALVMWRVFAPGALRRPERQV